MGESIERTNQVAARLEKIDRQIADEQVALSRLAERLRELDREADSIRLGRVRVVEGASRRGAPESDKRVQLAAVGLVGGFILSFGAFFILGSVDPRAFRVSQFRADSKTGRWLGVVPDMTTVVNDAAAKELASNCVHRIRNKIEARRQQGGGQWRGAGRREVGRVVGEEALGRRERERGGRQPRQPQCAAAALPPSHL